MSHKFNDSEMYYCDIYGEYLPIEEMYELEDGRIVCEVCANISAEAELDQLN